MAKALFIAEKPSVAKEFAKALKQNMTSKDGYLESEGYVVTWCVGHLVNMCYPESYDASLKRWSFDTIPFIPDNYLYQVIPDVQKQFNIVSGLLNRNDVDTIYVCTDSGREGEYIYRLVEQEAKVEGKKRLRVWIDSQTEEEIERGIREAKDLSFYDNLSDAAYLRAKEDYLMGINFSRALTLKYGYNVKDYLKLDKVSVSVGRVMTCVLGMIVKREREIRNFTKTPFYRVLGNLNLQGNQINAEWKAVEGSAYFNSNLLYKENGFNEKTSAVKLINDLTQGFNLLQASLDKDGNPTNEPSEIKSEHFDIMTDEDNKLNMLVSKVEKKSEKKNAPMLYNLAELQNDCSKFFKISPEQTLNTVQELYEKKLVTYPRTDARVLSTAISKEIHKNIGGLRNLPGFKDFAQFILDSGSYKKIASTKYVNDKAITDHYAIIPTGQGFNNLNSLSPIAKNVYEVICRRFLAIFYPPAVFDKVSLTTMLGGESFFASFKVLKNEGYREVMEFSFKKKTDNDNKADTNESEDEDVKCDEAFIETVAKLKKGDIIPCESFDIKEGETSAPKRYTSGSMILAMENAGQLIEDEELRAQIKSCGIGTSATRAGILEKLVRNKYIAQNNKTQVLTPTLLGEMINDIVSNSIRSLLNPELTASWEKGLNMVAEGTVSKEEYMQKLTDFVRKHTVEVKNKKNQYELTRWFDYASKYYK